MMKQSKPFHLWSMLFDALLCAGVLLLGEIIAAVICIMATGSREEGLGQSVYVSLPLGTAAFYAIRRRFGFVLTALQVIITCGSAVGVAYLFTRLMDLWSFDSPYSIFAALIIAFVLSKHTGDKIILACTGRDL